MKHTPIAILLAGLTIAGCNTHPVETPVCGPDGEEIQVPTGRQLCVYKHPIVIETGFSCPPERLDFFHAEPHFGTCSNFGAPVGIDRDFLFDRYAVPGRPWPTYATQEAEPSMADEAVDLLWVIDNSGSMCQEQAQLRENFSLFVAGLAAQNVDFQLAVTTTQMSGTYALEPVARPGAIQSQPQPVPGFDPSCHTAVDEMGGAIAGDYAPVRQSLAVAVECMAEPDMSFLDVTDADIECALYGTPQDCAIARAGCGGAGGPRCEGSDLFPSPDSYRVIPSVMRAADYRGSDGALDVEAVTADFACASLVGTRGYGIEKGLSSAVAAVAPENIASVNEGLLRDRARFAVMFVSDENDCSHDGTLAEDTACGGDICEFWNAEGRLGGPILPVADLKAQLLGNLAVSKGRAVAEDEVFVGSIHGQARRYSGDVLDDAQCSDADYDGIQPSCATELGVAYSGDRYDRFLAQFRNSFPRPAEDGSTIGWMCRGDFTPALSALGEWLAGANP